MSAPGSKREKREWILKGGDFAEAFVREGPPLEPGERVVVAPVEELRVCTICDSKTDKLYGGEGRYPAQCWGCWNESVRGDSRGPHVRIEWDGWAYVISDEGGRFAGVATDHPAASFDDVMRYVADLIHGPGTLADGSLRERTTRWVALNGGASGKEEEKDCSAREVLGSSGRPPEESE